jgi:uncharacterized protein YjhX (UPF0386 family)
VLSSVRMGEPILPLLNSLTDSGKVWLSGNSNGRVHSAECYRAYGEKQTEETGANILVNQSVIKVKKITITKHIYPAELRR